MWNKPECSQIAFSPTLGWMGTGLHKMQVIFLKKHTKRIFELDAVEVSLCSLLFSKGENTQVLVLT